MTTSNVLHHTNDEELIALTQRKESFTLTRVKNFSQTVKKSKVNCYVFMLEHLLSFSILRISEVCRVSRSMFYYWVENRHKAIQHEADRHKLIPRSKKFLMQIKNVMAQGIFSRNWLRAVIIITLRPLQSGFSRESSTQV